jgi:sporulation protein YlmC with PRC-barrel domain
MISSKRNNAMTATTKMKELIMLKKSDYLTSALLAASLMCVAPLARADHEKSAAKEQCSANEFIGKKVKNHHDEDLGKVQDLIINREAGTIPFAVIAHGGVLGAGRSKTAVPIESLKPSADGKTLIMSATKEQLQAASRTPTGAWASAENTEWSRNVDGFYGTPAPVDRYNRDRLSTNPNDRTPNDRTYVREPVQGAGAARLMTPADEALCQKICESTDLVQVRVENGVTHVYGTVDNEEERKSIESKIRSVQGVNKVESHLKVKNQ